VIKDGLITVEEFADAFMAGGGAEPQVTEQWLQEWEQLKKVVKKVAPGMENFRQDDKKITQLIKGTNATYAVQRKDWFAVLVY
jgi:hypothetical protein